MYAMHHHTVCLEAIFSSPLSAPSTFAPAIDTAFIDTPRRRSERQRSTRLHFVIALEDPWVQNGEGLEKDLPGMTMEV